VLSTDPLPYDQNSPAAVRGLDLPYLPCEEWPSDHLPIVVELAVGLPGTGAQPSVWASVASEAAAVSASLASTSAAASPDGVGIEHADKTPKEN
jgi:hypothetical protein